MVTALGRIRISYAASPNLSQRERSLGGTDKRATGCARTAMKWETGVDDETAAQRLEGIKFWLILVTKAVVS
jgi:hypothetical protein